MLAQAIKRESRRVTVEFMTPRWSRLWGRDPAVG